MGMYCKLSGLCWRDEMVKQKPSDDLEGETSEIFSHGSGELIKATQDVLGFRHARSSGFH